jgi:hypothetical protein
VFGLCRKRYFPVANGHIQSLCDSIAPSGLTAAFSTHSRHTAGYNVTISFRNEKSKSNILLKTSVAVYFYMIGALILNRLPTCLFPNVYKNATKGVCISLARYGPWFDVLNSRSCLSGQCQWEMSHKLEVNNNNIINNNKLIFTY